ncbi:hypothetical protein ACHAXN_008876 [Cyclotella atomus]
MKHFQAIFLLIPLVNVACPLASSSSSPPDDNIHSPTIRRRCVTSLSNHPNNKSKLDSIIENRQRNCKVESVCFTASDYDDIDTDVAAIAAVFTSNETLGYFWEGWSDYNKDNETDPYGPDGCIDFTMEEHAGLDGIWCNKCPLTEVWEASYSHISGRDFWVAELDLKSKFVWGPVDQNEYPNSAERLPAATGCDQIEEVFINRMGLSFVNAWRWLGLMPLAGVTKVNDGIWVDTEESVVFDKRFYEEIYCREWRPRNIDTDVQDWTRGDPQDANPKLISTLMCLVFNLDNDDEGLFPCWTCTDKTNTAGANPCRDYENITCVEYDETNPRIAMSDAIWLFATGGGNGIGNDKNGEFFDAFETAWEKATTNRWGTLNQLDTCISSSPTTSPSQSPVSSSSTASSSSNPISSSFKSHKFSIGKDNCFSCSHPDVI